jgi:hypothetical protein
MAADRELLAIVWGETWGLSPKDGNDQTRAHLQAVVTNLAAAARQRGLAYKLTKRLAPRSDDEAETAAYNAMRPTANAVVGETWLPQIPLPARAALWEINDNGAPRRDPALPDSAAWIFGSDAKAGGDFLAGSGPDQRTYRLFESTISPDRDELPYLSGYTGCGISAAAATAKAMALKKRIAWILGSISAISFLVGGVFAIESGQGDGVAGPLIDSLDGFAHSLFGLKHLPDTGSVIVPLLAMTLGIAGLAIALGLGTKGRITGIWIDERNRVSLARAQVTLWTIVALGGFATIALYNVGLAVPVPFPQIPLSITAALGIAFASPMLSALILDKQTFADPKSPLRLITSIGPMSSKATDLRDREVQADDFKVETRALPSEASLVDLFVGEHVADSGQIDISRLQNVVLTITLVLGYFAMLLRQLGGIPPESGLSSLPDPGASFTSVLLVSHVTYLGTKFYGRTRPTQDNH